MARQHPHRPEFYRWLGEIQRSPNGRHPNLRELTTRLENLDRGLIQARARAWALEQQQGSALPGSF